MTMPEMRAFEDYEDWLDFRAGMFWGLEMAGFTVNLVQVNLSRVCDLVHDDVDPSKYIRS